MREAFQKWALSNEYLSQFEFDKYPDDGDEYNAIALQSAWSAWQAAWEMSKNDNH